MVATNSHITHTFALLYISSAEFLAMENYSSLFDFENSLSEWTQLEYEVSDDDSGPDDSGPDSVAL